jgi:hypothetical protein
MSKRMVRTCLGLVPIFLCLSGGGLRAEPLLTGWITEPSGAYARLYETLAAEAAGASVTTWSRGAGVQSLPTYAGVSQVSYSDTHVYVRSSGMGFHVMGPWYLDGGPWNTDGSSYGTQLFGNLPSNTATLYRIPRQPFIPEGQARTLTQAGATGIFADGVVMFDARDTFSYDTSAGRDQTPGTPATVVGDRIWNRFAWITEGITFDPAQAHQAGNQYHYHASCVGPRFLLGDSVVYHAETNRYAEQFNGKHSPILGWAADGLPVYGPYGYADPLDPASEVRRMVSGYVLRDGTKGTDNLRETGRVALPMWVIEMGIDDRSTVELSPNEYGPDVDTSAYGETFVLGQYIEDHAYLGHLTNPDDGQPFEHGVDFDLGLYNQRWCVTPDYPDGTWAYFMTIEEDGNPVYPLTTGRQFFGVVEGGEVDLISEPVVVVWNGGPLQSLALREVELDSLEGDISIQWRGPEGGIYTVERSTDLTDWQTVSSGGVITDRSTLTHTTPFAEDGAHFYRLVQTGLADFDAAGFDLSGTGGAIEAVTLRFTFTVPLPPQGAVQSVKVGDAVGSIAQYDQTGRAIDISFDPALVGGIPASAVIQFNSPNGTVTATSSNAYTGGD